MAEGQTIVENGRVTLLFKTIWTIAASLIAAAIIGIFVKMEQLGAAQHATQTDVREIKVELKAQAAIQTLTNENTKDDITAIDRRLADIERQRRTRDRDDN